MMDTKELRKIGRVNDPFELPWVNSILGYGHSGVAMLITLPGTNQYAVLKYRPLTSQARINRYNEEVRIIKKLTDANVSYISKYIYHWKQKHNGTTYGYLVSEYIEGNVCTKKLSWNQFNQLLSRVEELYNKYQIAAMDLSQCNFFVTRGRGIVFFDFDDWKRASCAGLEEVYNNLNSTLDILTQKQSDEIKKREEKVYG